MDGHFAAICIRRSRCSSGSSLGMLTFMVKRVGEPRWAGSCSTSRMISPTSQPLRIAYISIVIAVHEARLAASSSCRLEPVSSPPWSLGSSAVGR